jgi:hypothetical protein
LLLFPKRLVGCKEYWRCQKEVQCYRNLDFAIYQHLHLPWLVKQFNCRIIILDNVRANRCFSFVHIILSFQSVYKMWLPSHNSDKLRRSLFLVKLTHMAYAHSIQLCSLHASLHHKKRGVQRGVVCAHVMCHTRQHKTFCPSTRECFFENDLQARW